VIVISSNSFTDGVARLGFSGGDPSSPVACSPCAVRFVKTERVPVVAGDRLELLKRFCVSIESSNASYVGTVTIGRITLQRSSHACSSATDTDDSQLHMRRLSCGIQEYADRTPPDLTRRNPRVRVYTVSSTKASVRQCVSEQSEPLSNAFKPSHL